jgi:hypothetical protein
VKSIIARQRYHAVHLRMTAASSNNSALQLQRRYRYASAMVKALVELLGL